MSTVLKTKIRRTFQTFYCLQSLKPGKTLSTVIFFPGVQITTSDFQLLYIPDCRDSEGLENRSDVEPRANSCFQKVQKYVSTTYFLLFTASIFKLHDYRIFHVNLVLCFR